MGTTVDSTRTPDVSLQNQPAASANPAGTIAQCKSQPVSDREINDAFRQFWNSAQANDYLNCTRVA